MDDAGFHPSKVFEGATVGASLKHWPIFIISLKEQPERWKGASAQLGSQGLSFERLAAVNGGALNPSQIRKVYDADRNLAVSKAPMTVEEIGCYLSHIEAWRRLMASDADAAIILEDDFQADPQFADVLGALQAAVHEWDIIKLHCGPSIDGKFVQPLTSRHGLFSLRRVPIRTLGYAISRAAAKRLTEISVPFSRPIDIDHKHFWDFDLRVFAVFPSVLEVDDRFVIGSTIGISRRKLRIDASAKDRILRAFRHLRDEARYQIKLYSYRNKR